MYERYKIWQRIILLTCCLIPTANALSFSEDASNSSGKYGLSEFMERKNNSIDEDNLDNDTVRNNVGGMGGSCSCTKKSVYVGIHTCAYMGRVENLPINFSFSVDRDSNYYMHSSGNDRSLYIENGNVGTHCVFIGCVRTDNHNEYDGIWSVGYNAISPRNIAYSGSISTRWTQRTDDALVPTEKTLRYFSIEKQYGSPRSSLCFGEALCGDCTSQTFYFKQDGTLCAKDMYIVFRPEVG